MPVCRRILALLTICCAVLSAGAASAEGEYAQAMKNAFIRGYNKTLKEVGQTSLGSEDAERTANCVVEHGMEGITVDERKQLDAWVMGGPPPSKELWQRTQRQMIESGLSGKCDQPANPL